ncbi:MAG: deoxynucleoside kinase [Ignavibacterium sp.]|nr:deoxynucleoside kinase [Ignavibacterium sp.]
MKRIDIIGAPGVGKSTLVNLLLEKRKNTSVWLTVDEAKTLIAKEEIKNNYSIIKRLLGLLILNIINKKKLRECFRDMVNETVEKKAFQEKLELWEPFIEFCVNCVGDHNKDAYYRLLLANSFLHIIKDVALIERSKIKTKVVFDYSLSQNVTGLISWNYEVGSKLSKEYFELMPRPDALIYIEATPEIIVDRIIQRSSEIIITQHRELSSKEILQRTKITISNISSGVRVLQDKGIPILTIDSTQSLDDAAYFCSEFLDQL